MDPSFQSAFNIVKGSVPARTDVPDTDFDACGKKAIADVKEASAKGTLMGSWRTATPPRVGQERRLRRGDALLQQRPDAPTDAAKQLVEAVAQREVGELPAQSGNALRTPGERSVSCEEPALR